MGAHQLLRGIKHLKDLQQRFLIHFERLLILSIVTSVQGETPSHVSALQSITSHWENLDLSCDWSIFTFLGSDWLCLCQYCGFREGLKKENKGGNFHDGEEFVLFSLFNLLIYEIPNLFKK